MKVREGTFSQAAHTRALTEPILSRIVLLELAKGVVWTGAYSGAGQKWRRRAMAKIVVVYSQPG